MKERAYCAKSDATPRWQELQSPTGKTSMWSLSGQINSSLNPTRVRWYTIRTTRSSLRSLTRETKNNCRVSPQDLIARQTPKCHYQSCRLAVPSQLLCSNGHLPAQSKWGYSLTESSKERSPEWAHASLPFKYGKSLWSLPSQRRPTKCV